MARAIEDLPDFQRERVETLVYSRFDNNHVDPTFAGAVLAKTPNRKYVLEITGASDRGSVIDIKPSDSYVQEAIEEAPVMDELDMRKLSR